MRFLDVKTLKLHSFDDASAYPPYAILSHCWYSSEQELTFKDFEDLSQHTSKPGYSKIVSACHAAVTQGYKWLWADSVCINAEDTVEKEDTVNSLYSMFLKAGVCLLYLSEIPNANIKDSDKEILSSAVRKSWWGSRAWTYKELIPPHKLVFYAADWSQPDPEFQAEISTNILGVNQDNGSKEDRKHFRSPLEGSTGAGPLNSFENFSSAPTVDEAERSMIANANAGRNLNITENGDLYKLTWSYSYTVKCRRGLRDNYGDDSKGDPIDPQANSQSVIKILILDNDHAVRNKMATLLKRLIPAQVTADSGDVVNLEKSGYDIVFARGEGNPLLHMPPNYSRRGAFRMFVYSARDVSHQVIGECQKQNFIEKLVSFVPGVEQDNENDLMFKFNVSLMSSSDLAFGSSEQESVGQDQLLGHPTIDSVTSDRFGDQQDMAHVPDDYRYRFYRLSIMDTGPADSCHHNPASVKTQSPHEHGSVQSDTIANSLYSSTIELTNQSHVTPPSTVPTSMPHQPQDPKGILGSLQRTECQAEEEEGILSSHHMERQNQWPPRKFEKNCAEFDAATTYSFDTLSDDPKLQYFQAFIDQLAEDVSSAAQCTTMKNVGPEFLEETLREFAWKLHGESTNPFQLETSVIIHRKRRHIVDLLELQVPAFETAESESGHSSMSSGKADYEDETPTEPFRKPEEMIVDWINDTGSGEPNGLSQMPQYRQFIQGSEAYQWLLMNISQQSRLSCEEPSLMNRIGATIRSILKEHIPHHKMSRKQACIDFEMTYSLTLDIIGMMKRSGISSSFGKALANILCLIGKCDEAQATSVAEYMAQTWPQSGGAIISLFQVLLSDQESCFSPVSPKTVQSSTWTAPDWPGTTRENYSNHCFLKGSIHKGRNRNVRYEITARGGYYAVSEVGEQIAWLASVFREHKHTGFISIMPRVTDFSATALNDHSGSTTSVMGKCSFSFSEISETAYNPKQGFCWEWLFSSLNIVRGYPILRRSVPNPGLEVPLRYATSIVGSSEVVQWDKRLVIKGFNMLMVATQVTDDVVVWHLIVKEEPGERMSYIDPRLNHIDIRSSEEISLRYIEGKRHIIGWCTKATDLCGHPTANHEIKPGGLPKASASIVIDKLYIEGGSPVTAGLMLDMNKKAQPVWLQREMDYPGLLNWVKLQPVVFYDVEERRAWLVDGASALLHLVRISLHLDMNDPESAYDWVYDPSKLKDHWPGVGSRQAALHTLKNWENRALNVYIVEKHMDPNGVPVTKYSTFEERVKRILHSIEKLIDRQAQTASQDGIKISQTLDPRRDVVGFDIVDVIDPAVPIYPRIQHLNSWGHGWIDLIPTVGITALFGRGFGDIIRADEPNLICPSWRSVPAGKDYLAASISTMQMLHEKRLLRMEPGLIGGDLTKKITWVAAKEASPYCKCLKGQASSVFQTAGSECNHSPVQFLAKKWWSRTIPHGLKPVHLGSLDADGAVIFGHTVLGLRTGDRSTSRHRDDDGDASMTSGEQVQDASATGSIVSQTTSITVPSVGHSSQDAESAQESLDGTSNATGEGKKKRWSKFKDWVKR